jgi:hypothetical protein
MQLLLELDARLSKLRRQFERISEEVSFSRVCSLSDRQKINQQTYRGIYLIEIRTLGKSRPFANWKTSFEAQWNDPLLKSRFTPGTKKKRMAAHSALKTWMPLYIGKSKTIWRRVNQHIDLGLDVNLFAMKLGLRPWLSLHDLRLSTLNFDEHGIKNYDVVAPALERALRATYNPVVGQ